MHPVPFAIKHAQLAGLKMLRPFAAVGDLTPARFDLLYQLHITRYRSPYQWRLAERLGVSRATICKMVHALRTLGFLELSVDPNNGHLRRITLTRFGRKRFARALRAIRRGRVDAAVRSAWRDAGLSRNETLETMFAMMHAVLRYSRGLGDHTELYRY